MSTKQVPSLKNVLMYFGSHWDFQNRSPKDTFWETLESHNKTLSNFPGVPAQKQESETADFGVRIENPDEWMESLSKGAILFYFFFPPFLIMISS